MRTKFGMLTALLLLISCGTGQAVTALNLTGPVIGNTLGPQSASNPCIIAATTCPHQPATMGYNLFSPNSGATFDRWSTTPTADLGNGVVGTPYNALSLAIHAGGVTFDVAFDVNTTSAESERLDLFQVWNATQNVLLYQYTGPTVVGDIANNGNGYGDWLIGSITLTGTGTLATDGILFRAVWANAVDGGESFFIVNGRGGTGPELFDVPPEVPLPAAVWMFGGVLGIASMIAGHRKRRRRSIWDENNGAAANT